MWVRDSGKIRIQNNTKVLYPSLVFKDTPDFGRGSVGYTTGFARKPTGASECAFSKNPDRQFPWRFLFAQKEDKNENIPGIITICNTV
jgi:hypothetical protein